MAADTTKKLFGDDSVALQAGLDIPFTAKTLRKMQERGLQVDCDLTMRDFVEKTLSRAKTGGAGTSSLTNGGQENA